MRFIFLIGFLLIGKLLFAVPQKLACTFNEECREGFVCVGSIASKKNSGFCEPIIPIRQVCFVHSLITGKFGKAISALVLVSMGIAFVTGKVDQKMLVTLVVGMICIFGSYQVLSLIVGKRYMMCELVDTTLVPSLAPDWMKNP